MLEFASFGGGAVRSLLMVAVAGLAGCTRLPAAWVRLGPADVGATIPGIDVCESASPGRITLDSDRPLVVLVHGCRSSGARFRTLAQVFAAHGGQAVCFNYDDRDAIEVAARQLRAALEALARRAPGRPVTVIAHSQGGLVARRALVADPPGDRAVGGVPYRLVTISSPFGGIRASADCGKTWLHVLTLGITVAVCQLVAGDKWSEIHPQAELVARPGSLAPAVGQFLKVVTDERGTCRRRDAGEQCLEDDFVFDLDEQANPRVDADLRMRARQVRAGHVEIVGEDGVVPEKLIAVLRAQGFLAEPPPEERAAMASLLRRLYAPR